MARQIRKKSGTGIYHVMLRGINRQDKTYRYFIWSDSKVDKMITRTDPVIVEVAPR